MQATNSTREQGVSAINGATLQRTRRRETAYTTISWDYPPSPTAYYDALLSCGASHSRLLRIAYLSTRDRHTTSTSSSSLVSSPPTSRASPLDTTTSPSNPAHSTSTTPLTSSGSHRKPAVRFPPIPPYPLSRSWRPRSANPMSHTLKRRKPQWPKPPHYHASLLRSPLSHRKGLFRAVLPPNKAVDFFRWDILLGAGVSLSASCQERDWMRSADVGACASVHVAESVLAPYEAAAGFFGWHGVGLDVARRDEGMGDNCRWSGGLGLERDGAGKCRSSDLQFEFDEAAVEEGKARWTRVKEELVGPPGLALRSGVEDGKSGKITSPSDPAHPPSLMSSGREEVRWDPDMGSSPFRPPRTPSASDGKRQSSSSSFKPERRTDSPSTWWYGPSPHRGPPPTAYLPPLRFLPPPPVQYGPPPPQFSTWFPGGRVGSAQGHGYWYGGQPVGAPPPMTRDPNVTKSLPSYSHVLAAPATPTSTHPAKPMGRDEYGAGDKETETDHGYESTTTTTDSDPPPHTPIGTATSHCVEAFQLHGDDEVDVHGVDIDAEYAAASLTIHLSDPTTPVKVLDRFSMSTSPSLSFDSLDSYRDGCESFGAAVVFPSLNGSFCQISSSQTTLSSPGMATPVCSLSLLSPKDPATQSGLGDEEDSKVQLKSRGQEASVSGDGPAFMQSHCSPPSMSPNRGLRKDSQGFWEPVTPVSPSSSSSSSSLPLSPSEGKMGSRPAAGWIGDKTEPASAECYESPGSTSSPSTVSPKSRSLSPGPPRVASVGSTRSSSSQPTSFSSPTTTPASASVFGGSYPSSPSPPDVSPLIPPNPTALLPAFLATATVKRKKASRTREIVDRLRSSSIDAGKGGVGLNGLDWLASQSGSVEVDGKPGKASDHVAVKHVAGGQPSPSPPAQSGADSASRVGSDSGKKGGQSLGSSDTGSPGSGGKSNGTTLSGSETHLSHANPRTVTTSANPSITPFPILSVLQSSTSNFTTPRQSQTGGTSGREPVVATPPKSASTDGTKKNMPVATPPIARISGPQLVPTTPNGGTSPSTRHSHHPLPSPVHPTVHPLPVLGPPPPIVAVATYPHPHPMYVPFTQYHIAPAHQGQQGQGAWLAVYPGHPPLMHPVPGQTHVPPPITGVSGMRHVSW
ncbi:hypothetical protein EV363DRAFT_1329742 [Boletus edulis]|nr:hypothetical protein EV363DRAFT_1329742 [Boletus edulis]